MKLKCFLVFFKKELGMFICLKCEFIFFGVCLFLFVWESEVVGSDSKWCWWFSEWYILYLVRVENIVLKYLKVILGRSVLLDKEREE